MGTDQDDSQLMLDLTEKPSEPPEALKRLMRGEHPAVEGWDDAPFIGGTDPAVLIMNHVRANPSTLSPRAIEEMAFGGSTTLTRITTQRLLDDGRLLLDDHLKLRVAEWLRITEGSFRLDDHDAVGWLQRLAPESVDLCVTDPAYESLEKHRARGTTTRLKISKGSSNEWFDIFPNTRFHEFFVELYRVMKKNTHGYVFCDQETMFFIKPIIEEVGFKFWKPLVWHKLGRLGLGYHWRAKYEFILFFEKGKRRLLDLGKPDVLEEQRVNNAYPTEKPVELIKKLVANSSQSGELVIDPFFGSGATGDAALQLGRRFMGTDTSKVAHEHASPRLKARGT
jgi:site-specific DNA-methyltransferase (adenine-specific)